MADAPPCPICDEVAGRYGYTLRITGVGEADPDLGCPTQLAVLTKEAPA